MRIASATAAGSLVLCVAAAAQQVPTFSSEVEVIRVDVLVTENGRPRLGLAPEDFVVRDGGVLQRVTLVEPAEPSLNVILALDTSASVAGEPLRDLRRAASALLDRLEPGDQAALVTFSHRATVQETLTDDVGRIERALARVEPSGETAATDGSYAALLLAEGQLDRDLVIVFSDGVDTSSWLTTGQVLEAARHADVVVYGVIVKGVEPPEMLEELSEVTGGSLLEIRSTRELHTAFLGILEEFRHRYLLSYSPQGVPAEGWRALDVRVKERGTRVRARAGYMARRSTREDRASRSRGVATVSLPPRSPREEPKEAAPAGPETRSGSPDPSPSQAPAAEFPGAVEQVVVDVVVTDREGRPVRDLASRDMEILEDGVRQAPTSFELYEAPEASAGELGESPRRAPPRPSVSSNSDEDVPDGSTFVVVFDDAHLSRRAADEARDVLSAFFTEEVRGPDRVTLIAPRAGVWWSGRIAEDREELLSVVDGLQGLFEPDLGQDRQSDYEAMRIHLHADSIAVEEVERRYRRRMPDSTDHYVRARAADVYRAAVARDEVVLAAMERALQALAHRRGRKSMILVSEGFVHKDELAAYRRALTASLRANTPIYFLNNRGLQAALSADEDRLLGMTEDRGTAPRTAFSADYDSRLGNARVTRAPEAAPWLDAAFPFGDAAAQRPEDRIAALSSGVLGRKTETAGGSATLARETGGFSVWETADLRQGLRRIANEARAYYLIGYSPTNAARDGEYRKIEVRVPGREGLVIRARRGYYAAAETAEAADTPPERDRALQRALDSPYPARGIGLRMAHAVGEETARGEARVRVVAEVDVRDVSLSTREGDATGALRLVMVAIDRASGESHRFDETLELRLTPQLRRELARLWLPIVREFQLEPGRYRSKMAVEDVASGRVGSVVHDFEVPETGTDVFRVSTPVLSDMWEPDPSGAAGGRIAITARREFAPDATLYCRLEVYEVARQPTSDQPRATLSYEVLGRGGAVYGRVSPRSMGPSEDGSLSQVIAFPLVGVPPDSYELVMRVRDGVSGRTIELREPFTVVLPPE